MRKNITLNILLVCTFLLSISIIIISAIFLQDIKSAPQLLVQVIPENGALPYYSVQNKLVEEWQKNCILILSISCFVAVLTIISFLRVNIFISEEAKQQEQEAKKQRKIEALEKELEELKNK